MAKQRYSQDDKKVYVEQIDQKKVSIAELARQLSVSEATIRAWHREFSTDKININTDSPAAATSNSEVYTNQIEYELEYHLYEIDARIQIIRAYLTTYDPVIIEDKLNDCKAALGVLVGKMEYWRAYGQKYKDIVDTEYQTIEKIKSNLKQLQEFKQTRKQSELSPPAQVAVTMKNEVFNKLIKIIEDIARDWIELAKVVDVRLRGL